ncbi:MAG: inorganic phosphate transporter [Planctomycetes bacterium]|nr:inorganic phosphate transporter [Planctomycetota bacterium]
MLFAESVFDIITSHPVLIFAVVVGFYMAWNIGANDVANAMGTSVGSKALTFRQAVIIAAIFEFGGAVLVGSDVTDTVRKGIIDPTDFVATEADPDRPKILLYGMLAALVAAALWLNVATYFGQPVSTTHSIVGGVFGFGLVASPGSVDWSTMGQIVLSWFISPLASGLLAMFVFWLMLRFILRTKEPDLAARRYAPLVVFIVAFILVLSFIYKGLKPMHLGERLKGSALENFAQNSWLGQFLNLTAIDWVALMSAVSVGLLAAIVSWFFIARIAREVTITEDEKFAFVERIFAFLQIVTAGYLAFAHGANDVANAIGPLAAVFEIATTGVVGAEVPVPLWILILGGVGIVVGLIMMGRKVMETVGTKITEITPSRGFAAQFAGATTVLLCSKMGLPVSTTHCLVGAVIGVALSRGIAALDVRTARNIFASWIATVPIAAMLTVMIYGVFWLLFI